MKYGEYYYIATDILEEYASSYSQADKENLARMLKELVDEKTEKMRQGIAAEVLAKVRTFVLDKEVGLKYLLDRTEKEYGITKGEK